MLLNAYGWWTVGTYALFAAIGLTIAAGVVLLTFVFELWRWRVEVRETRRRPCPLPRSAPRVGAGGRYRPDDQARQLTQAPLSYGPPVSDRRAVLVSGAGGRRGAARHRKRAAQEGTHLPATRAASRPLRSRMRAAGRPRHRGVASGSLRARRRRAGRGSALTCAAELADEPTQLWAAPGRRSGGGVEVAPLPRPRLVVVHLDVLGSSVRQGSMRSKTISWIVQSMSMISVI